MRELAGIPGVAFGGARAKQDDKKPTFQFFAPYFCCSAVYGDPATVRVSLQASLMVAATDTTYAGVDRVGVVCVRLCECARGCMCFLALERADTLYVRCWCWV